MVCTSKLPASHSLHDVGDWYMKRLGVTKQQLVQTARDVCKEGRALRVGTVCSGTDSPVAVLRRLSQVLGGRLAVEHTFSCEFDPRKRAWITDNFPSLKLLFGDVNELRTGKAMNYVTNESVAVPAVDILIAGFVCKSVSTENNEREKYSDCINEACGKTGETFDGTMAYVRKFRPRLVVCENVRGLTIRNNGAEPVINHVRASFNEAGYAFGHKVLDSRDFLLPQRRNRCWMWAFDGLENEGAVEQTGCAIEGLKSKAAFSFNALFKGAGVSGMRRQQLNARQRSVVTTTLRKMPACDRAKDIMIDVAKSEYRAPSCIGAASCIVPNSLPYRVRHGSILTPEQVHCVQGIYVEDFPALRRYASEKHCLTRDLAGNAFSTTVCMAVLISCLAHAPAGGVPSPATPPRHTKALGDLSPVPTSGKRRRADAAAELAPLKRTRCGGA